MATAAARLSSTTGDGSARSSRSYKPTICAQSVSAALGGVGVHGGDRRLQRVRARRPAERALDERHALGDERAIPAGAILRVEQDHLARG